MAAGDDAGVGVEPAQQADRLAQVGGSMIFEGAGYQVRPPVSARESRIRAPDKIALRAAHNQRRMNWAPEKGANGGWAHEMRQRY